MNRFMVRVQFQPPEQAARNNNGPVLSCCFLSSWEPRRQGITLVDPLQLPPCALVGPTIRMRRRPAGEPTLLARGRARRDAGFTLTIQRLRRSRRATFFRNRQHAHLEVLQRAADAQGIAFADQLCRLRSEEHTSELQSLMRISYAVFCLKKKKNQQKK